MNKKQTVILVVLDGWGQSNDKQNNAIFEAKTPCFDKILNENPHSFLEASGEAVGLPKGQMGNSEVGHISIGAGTTIDTDLVRITKAAQNEEFEHNPAFAVLFNHVKRNDSILHINGLIGPGGVHSHSEHLYSFLKTAKKAGIDKIAIHAFTDGRDTPPQSAKNYFEELENIIENTGIGFIASASGRFYAMDRDHNWDRLKKVENAIFEGKSQRVTSKKPSAIINELYQEGIVDEHLEPIIFLDDNNKSYQVQENDGVLFFNFRADRARMLSKKISEKAKENNICFVSMTQYDKNLNCLVAFPPIQIQTTLAAEISKAGLTQIHIAETEKFAHATYFLNGGKTEPHLNEKHELIESRKDINTYDQAPKMCAEKIANKAIEYISKKTDFIFINFANPDMVGHTGNKEAVIEAVEEVDKQLERIIESANKNDAVVFVTSDHGNAEKNYDHESGSVHTAHTTNLVPAIFVGKKGILNNGTLADIAPTILSALNLKTPEPMTGKNLLV